MSSTGLRSSDLKPPLERLVDALLLSAVYKNASAILLTATPPKVEFTITGLPQVEIEPPPELLPLMIRRIGVLACFHVYRRDEVAVGSFQLFTSADYRATFHARGQGHGALLRVELQVEIATPAG